ncbi:uncharacterized protein LOC128788454 isoform X1 [Vidua chalybeata]|uniref:uncharacterized protein LOC128788454 isoform X1 n=1 Tax=Vidua chalybeata TaxID=81927 RepID=UPI0023A8D66C|nr:uncharacterized protein LOC128788454 isoform X1 [Vidua chalybeata]
MTEKKGSGEGGPAGPLSAGGGGAVAALTGRGRRAGGERRRNRAALPFPDPRARPSLDAGSDRVPENAAGAARRRRSGAPAFPAPPAAIFGRSSEPSPSRRVAVSSRRVPAASPCFPAVSTLTRSAPVPDPLRCREMQENAKASGQSSRWRCPSRLPLARRAGVAHRRQLTATLTARAAPAHALPRCVPVPCCCGRTGPALQRPEQSAGEWEARKAWAKDGLQPGCLSVLESGRRVPAGCRVLGGHRALTSARWAVRFLSHRFPGVLILTSPKPQASLPGPLPLPYLLDAVQNGIRQPSLRFTFSLTLCAARVAQQILKPEEHVYIRVKRFLLSHRYLDLRKVPGFLQLFYSFDFERTRSCAVYAL